MTQLFKSRKVYQFGVLLCIIGGISSLILRNSLQNTQKSGNSSTGFPQAVAMNLPDSSDRPISLNDFKGKWVILHFWASWCAPCLDEIPQWVELGTYFQDKPVQLVAVSEDEKWADAQKILPSEKLAKNITSVLDRDAQVSDQYGTFQFPETYLIDPEQKIRFKWVGPQDWGRKETHEFIEKFFVGI